MYTHAKKRWILSIVIGLAFCALLIRLLPVRSSSALTSADFAHSTLNIHTGDAKMLADFTGDGKLDWAVGGMAGGGEPLEIYPYPFAVGSKYKVADPVEEFTTDAEAADMDGDGDIDIVAPEWQRPVRLFLNSGNGQAWTEAAKVTNFSAGFKDVEIADFDRDGKNDVALRTDQGELHVAYNMGAAASWNVMKIGAIGGEEGMDTGDIDGDGDMDIIGQGNWYVNPGTRTGAWQTRAIGSADGAFRAIAADFNKDGKMDVAFSCAECASDTPVHVYLQTASGWTAASAGSMAGAHTLEAADLDGDGDVDMFIGSMSQAGSKAAVLENGGNGTSWTRRDLTAASGGIHIGRAGDIDRDGDIDLIGMNYTGGSSLNRWENKTQKAGCITPSQLALGTVCGSGVGVPSPTPGVGGDTASLDSWSPTTKLATDSTGSFYWRMLGTGTKAQADVNGDGYADIASGENVWISPGTNAKTASAWTKHGGFQNVSIIADIDRDGKTDDVVDIADGSWYKWNGSGFSKKATPASMPRGQQGYAVGDVVPGGYLEVVYASSSGPSDSEFSRVLVEYSSSGATGRLVAGGASDEGIDLADIDRDGLLDIVGSDGDEYGWWKNINNGQSFTKHMIGDRTSGFFSDKTLARDLNRDGKIEIIGSAETSGSGGDVYVFTQTGSDIAAKSSWTRSIVYTQGSTNSLDIEDMDGDGYVDIVTGDFTGSKLVVAKNPGNATFTNWATHTVTTDRIPHHGGTQAGDFDGDGILDVASIDWPGNTSSLYVWINESTTGGGGGGGTCGKKTQGDADCNGAITLVDFQIWLTEYLGNTTVKADFNVSGKTTLADFEIWRSSYVGQ